MLKLLTIIGARPQIIKASALSRTIAEKFSNSLSEFILHTGQHYDRNMSDVFFEELRMPRPNLNLNVGSLSHAKQTALMLEGIEQAIKSNTPDAVVVYGDTNSTLAGALAASKMSVPVVHIEAGLRSFNKSMPEEINRVLTDHVSTLLFCPTQTAVVNLEAEGFGQHAQARPSIDAPSVVMCGDIMFDNALYFSSLAVSPCKDLQPGFILATIHRQNNTDEPERLRAIIDALNSICEQHGAGVVIPLHPRTRQKLEPQTLSLLQDSRIKIIEPATYLEMLWLEKNASIIITDSGGVQKESFFFRKPCIVLREETEWKELVENGNNILAGADKDRITSAYDEIKRRTDLTYPEFYGAGRAAEIICESIIDTFGH